MSYAESAYFDFVVKSFLVSNNKDIAVNFKFDISNQFLERFTVRPVLSNGIVSIYNDKTGAWVLGNSFWSDLPKLQKDMRIKINGFTSNTTGLYFEIYDTKTFNIYDTPKKKVWNHALYDSYILTLNQNINDWNNNKSSEEETPVGTGKTVESSKSGLKHNSESKIRTPIFSSYSAGLLLLGCFLIFVSLTLFGYFGSNIVKMIKLRNEKIT